MTLCSLSLSSGSANSFDIKKLYTFRNDRNFSLTEEDFKNGIRFLCADGMHRVRCVQELTEEKKRGNSDIKCGDSVFAVVLRPDVPKKYIIGLSISKCLAVSCVSIVCVRWLHVHYVMIAAQVFSIVRVLMKILSMSSFASDMII